MKLRVVVETLNRRLEWLEEKLKELDEGSGAWHWTHQEYVALQEALRLVAKELAARAPEKMNG